MNHSLSKLTVLSRNSSQSFESFFDWESYDIEHNSLFLPIELISIYGSKEFEVLTPWQIRELSRIEAIQILYLYAYTESVMCLYLARHLVKSDFGSEEHAFILREQIEEYRHQDMFLRWLEILGKDFNPMSWFTRWWTGVEAIILPAKYFFLLQITIELISREVWRMTFPDSWVSKLVRDLSLMHEREEARHIAFSDHYLEEAFRDAWFFVRTLAWFCIALNIAFINHFYIYRGIYTKAEIWNDINLYKIARIKIRENPLKNMLTGSALAFLQKYKWMTWANAWMFHICTSITYEKIYGKN